VEQAICLRDRARSGVTGCDQVRVPTSNAGWVQRAYLDGAEPGNDMESNEPLVDSSRAVVPEGHRPPIQLGPSANHPVR
jgi:hypothetical protein